MATLIECQYLGRETLRKPRNQEGGKEWTTPAFLDSLELSASLLRREPFSFTSLADEKRRFPMAPFCVYLVEDQ
jgi:hypothetical protein